MTGIFAIASPALLAMAAGAAPSLDEAALPEPGPRWGVRYIVNLGPFEFLKINQEQWSRPYISRTGSRMFIGLRSNRLEAREMASGRILWTHPDFGTIGAGMAEWSDLLLVGADSDLAAVDQQTGQTRWRVDLSGSVAGPMALYGDLLLVPIRPNAVVGVDLAERQLLWRQKRPTPEGLTIRGQAFPTVDPARGLAYLGFSDGTLMAVRPETGEQVWGIRLPGGVDARFKDVDARPWLVDEGRGLLVAGFGQGVFLLDPETGREIYSRELLGVTAVARAEPLDVWVFALGTREVVGFDPELGRVIWRYSVEKGFPNRPVPAGNGEVFVGSSRGATVLLDGATGRPLQSLSPGSGTSTPLQVRGEQAVLLSNKALVMVMRRGRGDSISGVLPKDPGRQAKLPAR